jgi:hypothetical protein
VEVGLWNIHGVNVYNVKYHQAGQTTKPATFSWHREHHVRTTMLSQNNSNLSYKEGRINLALQAYILGQFKSLRRAAAAFSVQHQRLSNRLNKIKPQAQVPPNCQKLSSAEKQTIVQYILNLDARGFALQLCEVADIADKILAVRSRIPVSKNWAKRFVQRTEELKIAYTQAKDRQRILQEDPKVISAWFELVRETKAKYGVLNNNIHNFNKTGF